MLDKKILKNELLLLKIIIIELLYNITTELF